MTIDQKLEMLAELAGDTGILQIIYDGRYQSWFIYFSSPNHFITLSAGHLDFLADSVLDQLSKEI